MRSSIAPAHGASWSKRPLWRAWPRRASSRSPGSLSAPSCRGIGATRPGPAWPRSWGALSVLRQPHRQLPGGQEGLIRLLGTSVSAEPAAAPDRGRIPAFQSSTAHRRPRQVSWVVGRHEMSTRKFKGFGPLKGPKDLLEKLRYDFERMRGSPDDEYAAFDFFVSAYHMLDWLHPCEDAGRAAEERGSPLLQVCSHLANGAKHFQATLPKHTSIDDVRAEPRAFQRNAFQSDAFQVGGLVIQLDGQAANVFGSRVWAVELARQVLAHWESDSRLK